METRAGHDQSRDLGAQQGISPLLQSRVAQTTEALQIATKPTVLGLDHRIIGGQAMQLVCP